MAKMKKSKKGNGVKRILRNISKYFSNIIAEIRNECKRGRSITIALIVSLIVGVPGVPIFAVMSFVDLNGSWVKPFVEKLENYGYPVSGYEDGTFRPNEPCTRGEFYSILAHVIVSSNENDYMTTEASQHWAYKYWADLSTQYFYKNDKQTLLPENEEEIALTGNKEYFDTKITRIEVARVTGKLLEKLYNKPLATSEVKFSDTGNISEADQKYLSMLVEAGVMSGDVGNIFKPNEVITRGELVTLAGNIADRYGFVDAYERSVRRDNLPKNYKEFAYIADGVDNSIYEQPMLITSKDKFKKPVDLFSRFREKMGETIKNARDIFEVSNFDYRNYNRDEIYKRLSFSCLATEGFVDEFIQSLVKQGIVMECKAMPEPSIIYNDGNGFRIRTKLSFKILECNSDYAMNVFYGDRFDGGGMRYKVGTEYNTVVDQPLSVVAIGSNILYAVESPLSSMVGNRAIEKEDGMLYFE